MDIKTACEAFRAVENNEVAAIVVLDRALQSVLSVWPMVRRDDSAEVAPGASLADLWNAVRFDEREVVDLSGLPSGSGLATLRRAKALGLIYPDGSIHRLAAGVLRKTIRDALGSGGKTK